MKYALIENGLVTNIIILSHRNTNEFPNVVALNDRAVSIGDQYIDGKFYHNGKQIFAPHEITQQEITDADLERIAAQQTITDQELQILALEAGA